MVLDTSTVTPRIRDYISRSFLFSDQGYPYGDDASFLEEGVIDSLGIIELVSFVEKDFGISVADHELLPEHFDSVTRLAAYILRKTGNGS